MSPRSDLHDVLMAYSGIRGAVLVVSGAAVFVIAAFRAAAASRRIGVGVLTAMATAVIGATGCTLFITGLAKLSPSLLRQLGPLSTLVWPGGPFNVVIILAYSLQNYLMLIALSIAPALIGATMGRAFAGFRSNRVA